jgi:predicted GNAT family N-acyltransferase
VSRSAHPPLRPQERVTVVRTLDEYLRAAAIRSIVYVGDQACPYDEEFDGNDFCGLHLIGWVGGEAAACLRMRFFGGFAKLERLAVRPEFRRSNIAFAIVRQALRLAARKGFPKAYGHAREGLEPFWARFGARPVGARGAFSFSGHRYTEMALDLPAAPDALDIGADPLALIRPEGAWDEPGVLERRAPEAVTYPAGGEPSSTPGWSPGVRDAWLAWSGGAGGFREDGVRQQAPGGGGFAEHGAGWRPGEGAAERRRPVLRAPQGASPDHRGALRPPVRGRAGDDAAGAGRKRRRAFVGRMGRSAQAAGADGPAHRVRAAVGANAFPVGAAAHPSQ